MAKSANRRFLTTCEKIFDFFTVANRSLRKPLVFVHSKALLLMPEHPCSRAPKPAVLRDLQTCEKIFDFFTAAKPEVLQTPKNWVQNIKL
jgi:hypothetical protein